MRWGNRRLLPGGCSWREFLDRFQSRRHFHRKTSAGKWREHFTPDFRIHLIHVTCRDFSFLKPAGIHLLPAFRHKDERFSWPGVRRGKHRGHQGNGDGCTCILAFQHQHGSSRTLCRNADCLPSVPDSQQEGRIRQQILDLRKHSQDWHPD